MACKWALRAMAETSCPACAKRAARIPPIAPAPTMQTLMGPDMS